MPKGLKYAHLQEEWINLYKNENKSFREIATQYNIDAKTVARTLNGLVTVKPKSPWDSYAEEWYSLYVNEGYSKADIAKKHGIFPGIVARVLKKLGVPINKVLKKRKYQHLVDDFIGMYSDGYSLFEIGRKYDIDKQTVLNYLNSAGVNARGLSESIRKYELNENYFDVIDGFEKAYHLGLLFAVGSLLELHNGYVLQVTMHIDKKHIIEPLVNVLRESGEGIYIGDDEVIRARFSSKHLYVTLKQHGLGTRKDFTFPRLDEELHAPFLAGYAKDRIYPIGKNQGITISGSEKFLNSLKLFLSKIIQEEKIKIRRISEYEHCINIYGKEECEKFYNYIDIL